MEQFVWTNDLRQIEADIKEEARIRDRIRHAKYYEKNRKKVLRKQKRADAIRDRKSKEYYEQNKERILAANRKRYYDNLEERRYKAREHYQLHKEEISKRRKELRNANK
jgi:hypothetical protein